MRDVGKLDELHRGKRVPNGSAPIQDVLRCGKRLLCHCAFLGRLKTLGQGKLWNGTTVRQRARDSQTLAQCDGRIRERNTYGNDPFPPKG